MEKRGNINSKLFFITLHQNEGFGFVLLVWFGFEINVRKSNTLRDREKWFQEISEGMAKQISSSFLVIASMKAAELEIIG